MQEFFPFFLVLFVGVFFSDIFRRLHLPWVIALLLGGILIGPYVLDVFEVDGTIDFIGQIGLIFLMFMAGLETRLSVFQKYRRGLLALGLLNGLIPMAVGAGIGMFFGYSAPVSILLGIIFVSSSIAVVIPSLEANKIIETRLGALVMGAAIVEDILSLLLLSIFLQTTNTTTPLPLPILYALLIGALIVLRWLLPKIQWFFSRGIRDTGDLFQQELRSVFVVLIGTVIIFEVLGLHPIIAGFFTGLVLSDTLRSEVLLGKIRALSYGIFIPTFFIVVGAKTDISVFGEADGALFLTLAIVIGSILSKLSSGWLGGRLLGFNQHDSFLIGISKVPQLSTTLAVAFTGAELGILSRELVAALVILSIITTFIGPLFIRFSGPPDGSPSLRPRQT